MKEQAPPSSKTIVKPTLKDSSSGSATVYITRTGAVPF